MSNDKPKYAQIAFPIPVDMSFTYILPEELQEKAHPGMRVLTPFGKGDKETEGVIVGISSESDMENLKEVTDI